MTHYSRRQISPSTIPPYKSPSTPPPPFTLTSRRTPPPKPRLPPPQPPPLNPPSPRPLRHPLIIGGVLLYMFSGYVFYTYTTLTRDAPAIAPDADTSSRYDERARHADADIAWTEKVSGINGLRRKLARKAHGHVLEASVGTGRNAEYFNLWRCRSLTFVDQSAEMVAVAREKFDAAHPGGCAVPVRFCTQSVLSPLPADVEVEGGYDTVLQTMGLCSTPEPAAMLARLGALARRDGGRVLLLEHGRSYYGFVNWMLDRAAGAHAVRHGCWWNRDIGAIVARSGLVVERMERSNLGTTWWVELRPRRKGDEGYGGKETKGDD